MTRNDIPKSAEVFDYIKIAGMLYLGYKAYKIISGFSDYGKGGGTGTAQVDNACKEGKLKNLTYNTSQYKLLADAIEAAVWSSVWTEDDAEFAEALKACWTDDDVTKLICEYGVRGRGLLIKEHYNLPQTVEQFLDDGDKEDVNTLYNERGMTIYWI